MGKGFDAVVVGAGHNGLTCACYLARAGLRVLALDRFETFGGMTITEEITLPEHRSDIHASGYLVAKLTPAPEELELSSHGLDPITPDPNWAHLFPDGRALSIFREPDKTAESIARFSDRDSAAWRATYERYQEQREAIGQGMCSPAPSLSDHARALEDGALAGYRFETQSSRSWANEVFEAPEVRTAFSSFALHAAASPDDVGGGEFALLFAASVQDVGCSLVKGGMHSVSAALAADLEAHGGEVRTAAPVAEILTEESRATGVRLENGEEVDVGSVVASSVDPRHFALDLLGEQRLGANVAERVRRYEWGDAFFAIYAALDGPPEYAAGDEPAQACYVHVGADTIDHLSLAFAQTRAGYLPQTPMLGVINESLVDPSRTPPGKHLIKLVAHFVPYEIRGDATGQAGGTGWDEVKEAYADFLIDQVSAGYIPNLRDRIVKRVVQSPRDLERRMPTAVHGTHQHGAFLPYQNGAMRPVPELGNYRTPFDNIYLCGAGSHPGSGVSMAPGRNASEVICRDLGVAFPGRALSPAAT
jgi:phytoene dehydrogenase-like protein